MSKYKNVRTECDGIWFDSIKEKDRYLELKMLLRAGIIRDLQWHVPFDLYAYDDKGNKVKIAVWKCDFQYQSCETGRTTIEDVKSPPTRTKEYQLKKKLFEANYGLRIIET